MSVDYRRAKKIYSFFVQRPIIIANNSSEHESVDVTRMRKTYSSYRIVTVPSGSIGH